jgi:hypothetical protein
MSTNKMREQFETWLKPKIGDECRQLYLWDAWQAALASQASVSSDLHSAYDKSYQPYSDETYFPFADGYQAALASQESTTCKSVDKRLAVQTGEPVQFKFPRNPDTESKWVIDTKFINTVSDLIEDTDFLPSDIEIEEVLLAVETLYPVKSEPVQVSQPVYQFFDDFGMVWLRCTKDVYETFQDGTQKRIVYLAPPDYEALRTGNDNLKLRIGEWERVYVKKNAEIEALRQRVAELEESNINKHYMSRIEALNVANSRLQSECDLLRVDAERYQFLRVYENRLSEDGVFVVDDTYKVYFGDDLDTVIDEALKEQAK